MACFCGGLGKFSEMLTNVKGLLCEFHNHDHDDSLLGAASPSLDSDATQNQVSRTMCSLTELWSCTGEIRSAYTHCIGKLPSAYYLLLDLGKLSIRTCISDILGASDCYKCVCDVLTFICGTEESHDQDHHDSLLGAAAPSLESFSDAGVPDEGNDASQNQESMSPLCGLCTFDIMTAYAQCKHLIIKTSIRTCINDILGTTSDCLKCVCDVLPILCAAEESHHQDHDDSLLGAEEEVFPKVLGMYVLLADDKVPG